MSSIYQSFTMQENNIIVNNNNFGKENQPAKAKPSISTNKSKKNDKGKTNEKFEKDKHKKVTTSTQLEPSVKITNQKGNSKKKTEDNKVNLYDYKKRKGTAGLSGQLYETKLLALILHRTLYNDQITDFLLGTNMDGIGEFDDVILRYKTNDSQISKVIFLQAKHRDDSTREVTYEDLLKQQGDFSFSKYFESYLKIKQKFASTHNDLMFRGSTKDTVCNFIIYTPATANFSQKRIKYCEEESLIRSTKHGKMFQLQFDNEDIKVLMHNVAKSRAIVLAKSLLKFVLKDNNSYNIIMLDDLMHTYHVFLGQNVIVAVDSTESKNIHDLIREEYGHPYFMAKFRESFLTSSDCYLQLMKNVIYREIADIKGISTINQQQEVENILRSLVFKLPVNFGNQCFHLLSFEKRQERTFLCSSTLKKLLDRASPFDEMHHIDSNYCVIKLGNDLISDGKNNQSRELGAESMEQKNLHCRLGELVGNLLIMDDKTDMLKFNLDMQSLSEDNTKILKNLQEFKENYDLTNYRFDVHLSKFPRLCLIRKEHDRLLLINFLNYLKFYTNQAKEDEVEYILQKEIDRFCNIQQKHNDSLIRVKCDAIFLKVHDMVLKWWQQPDSAPYLNKSCTFYHQAEMEIIDSPVLNIVHFIYREKLKRVPVEFKKEAIDSLGLEGFLKSDNKYMVIVSEDIDFSSIKVIQYFDEIKNDINYLFVDLDCMITENCLDIIKSELCNSSIPSLILITQGHEEINRQLIKLKKVMEPFTGNILIITNSNLIKDNLKTVINDSKSIFHIDDKNDFNSLSTKCRNMILHERKVTFQGEIITIETAFNETSLNFLSLKLLKEIIYNKNIEIGKSLLCNSYRSVDYYIDRKINRAITLNDYTRTEKELNIYTIEDGVDANMTRALDKKCDIVVISKSIENFEEVCKKYNNSNVHWCIRYINYDILSWERTHGRLKNIMKYTSRGSRSVDVHIKTLKDVEDKIVILRAEPGEGKSTLLFYLAIKTKHQYPDLWILRINLLEYIDLFSNWKKHKTEIDLVEAMIFLYSTAGFKDFRYQDIRHKQLVTANSNNKIYFNISNDKDLCLVDLSLVQLFTYFYNNNKLAVLFDGFDEICPDYSNEVLELLRILKSSKVKHLWVTTRPYHVLEKLEDTLGTFSFHFMGFNPSDQRIFLQNVWTKKLNLDESLDSAEIYSYVDKFLTTVTSIHISGISEFTYYGLHLYMIAELYQDVFRDFVMTSENPKNELDQGIIKKIKKVSNLTKIYERFTNMKFYTIRFAEKNQSVNLKHPDTRRLVEKERKEFVDIHQKASAFELLNKKVMLSKDDLIDVYNFFHTVRSGEEKTGIVELGLSKNPEFIHRTFAEYFAVEFIFDKLRTGNCFTLWLYLITDIMINKEGIQRFVNSKLQDDSVMTELISNEKHMSTIRNIILQNCNMYFTAIYVAIDLSHENSAIFLLHCIKTVMNKGNLLTFLELINKLYRKRCIFCIAVERDAPLIVKHLIELVADINSDKVIHLFNCLDSSKLNPILVIKDEQMNHLILNIIQNHPLTALKLFNSDLKLCQYKNVYTIINGFQKMCRNYLLSSLTKAQRVQIFSFKDMDGKLPVHQAAKENDYDFFIAMNELVGRHEFKNMCLTPDNHGLIPIYNFPYDEISYDKFKNLLEMIYEDINLDEVKFKFNELSKLDS